MNEFVIGLIAEGPSDQQVLKSLISAYIGSKPDLKKGISFIDLQPIDKTTGGGWRNVYKWCISNNSDERDTLLGKNRLFANDMDNQICNALLIHMDSDICERIGNCSTVIPVPDASSLPHERGNFIKKVIENWLWPAQFSVHGEHIIAPAVESIEAWLVAGISNEELTPESNKNIQKRLAELYFTDIKNTAAPANIKKPSKKEKDYKSILDVVGPNVQQVFDRCPHFQYMVEEISVLMNTHAGN